MFELVQLFIGPRQASSEDESLFEKVSDQPHSASDISNNSCSNGSETAHPL